MILTSGTMMELLLGLEAIALEPVTIGTDGEYEGHPILSISINILDPDGKSHIFNVSIAVGDDEDVAQIIVPALHRLLEYASACSCGVSVGD